MNMARRFLLILAALTGLAASAGELSPEVSAKFLKAIVSSSGSNKIACADAGVKAALEAAGVTVDGGAQIVWATNANEARMGKQMGRLVVTPKRELASMSCILLEESDGHPKMVLNTGNLKSARVQLGDAIMKIAEKI